MSVALTGSGCRCVTVLDGGMSVSGWPRHCECVILRVCVGVCVCVCMSVSMCGCVCV